MDIRGTGSFNNGSAAEFLREIAEDGVAALREPFEVALDPDLDDLDAEEGARAIAAAEVTLSALGEDKDHLPLSAEQMVLMDEADQLQLAVLRDTYCVQFRRIARKRRNPTPSPAARIFSTHSVRVKSI